MKNIPNLFLRKKKSRFKEKKGPTHSLLIYFQAFIHVSTAYANCNRQNVDEKFYKPRLSGENALKLAECLDEKLLDAITPEVIKEWPNTYTFTKCLAEDLVRQNCKGLPTAIFRPAIGECLFWVFENIKYLIVSYILQSSQHTKNLLPDGLTICMDLLV